MKNQKIISISNQTIIKSLLFFLAITFNGCSDDSDDPSDLANVIAEAEIGVEGGSLQASDQNGNRVIVTFPPGAIMDTIQFTLTLVSADKNLPIDERQLPLFEIRPLDVSLYKPVDITIEYNTPVGEIEKAALFRVRSDQWLTPLSDHTYSDDNRSMTASTLFFGDFAEGKMTLAQLNTQFDLLVSALGISWESGLKAAGTENQLLCDTKIHKATWDVYRSFTGSFLSIFKQRLLLGYYNDLEEGQNTFVEDQAALCANVVSVGIQNVLDLCIPEDLCDRDYTHTIIAMLKAILLLGCEGPTIDLLEERADQVLVDCGTFLTITSELTVESGGMQISTMGVVQLTLTADSENTASVTGNGTLDVTGSADAGGGCTGVVSGETYVTVYGTRDAAYTYELDILLAQNAVLSVLCPDGSGADTPLIDGQTRNVTLSSANGYSLTVEEPGDGYEYVIDTELMNPYTDLPDSK